MANLSQYLNIIINTDASRAKRELRGFQDSFTELKSKIDVVTMAFEQTFRAIEAVYRFAREGADIERIRGQFENLATSIGTTADTLLSRMADATGGLMSNAEMISSATQIISLGLADNETDVIRLATIVSELGWDMQQVILTFANNSTMRLDALGLSVQDVTTKAKALEEQGFNADKAFDLAVLEAAEEKIGLVGSQLDQASASYARFEAHIKNAVDAQRLMTNSGLEPAIKATSNFLDVTAKINDAYRAGHIDLKLRIALIEGLRFGLSDEQKTLELLDAWLEKAGVSTRDLAAAEMWLSSSTIDTRDKVEWLTDATELYGSAAIHAQDSIEGAPASIREVGEAAADAAPDIYTFSDALDDAAKGRPSAVAGLIEDIKWLQAGGADVGQLIADIEGALEAGIDPAAVGDSLATALVGSLLASMQAGQTDFEGASQTLQDTLGIDAAEADAMLSEFESAADAIAEAERELQYAIILDPNSERILANLTALLGIEGHTLNINIAGMTGGSFGGVNIGSTGSRTPKHFGTDFVVPPGYNNDSYPINVESGERVTVTPASEVASGRGGMGAPSQIIVMLDGEQIAARVMTKAGRDYRTTRANGGGYTGR